jgi:3-dehydroquinate dehydratase-2
LSTKSILVANGVNLDLLGIREPGIYGNQTLNDLENLLQSHAQRLAQYWGFSAIKLAFVQTNCEGKFIDSLTSSWDGIIINPGAWTHTSLAIADRLACIRVPYIEVHISNTARREKIRHKSMISPGAAGIVSGLGLNGYVAALFSILAYLSNP